MDAFRFMLKYIYHTFFELPELIKGVEQLTYSSLQTSSKNIWNICNKNTNHSNEMLYSLKPCKFKTCRH